MKYYFLQTIKNGNDNKLRPLPNQTNNAGEDINEMLNTQADRTLRCAYPIGTVFATDMLQYNEKRGTPYYSAGKLYPVGLTVDAYLDTDHVPPIEMQDAYKDYLRESQVASGQASTTPADGIPIGSLRERLLKKNPKPTIAKDGFYIKDIHWQLILRNIMQKVNTMMVGPTGTGKTELVMLAAKSLGLPCSVYDMGSMHDPIAGMLGTHRLQKGGQSVFDYAKFTQDIQKPGVILLDELSRAPVTTLNILFPCLDSRRMLPVEIAGGDDLRSISVHPECVFFATANVGAEYTGTAAMDRALTGRFLPLELEYMPKDEEAQVLMKRYSISKNDAKNIASVAAEIRDLYSKEELSISISTRETLMAASLVADGWSALMAMELTFLPLFEGNSTDGERSIISKVILTQ